MTKDEFIANYACNSQQSIEEILKHNVCLPCHCDFEQCTGWAMVSNDEISIKSHTELYGGKE